VVLRVLVMMRLCKGERGQESSDSDDCGFHDGVVEWQQDGEKWWI
jgi:hypothetical protein